MPWGQRTVSLSMVTGRLWGPRPMPAECDGSCCGPTQSTRSGQTAKEETSLLDYILLHSTFPYPPLCPQYTPPPHTVSACQHTVTGLNMLKAMFAIILFILSLWIHHLQDEKENYLVMKPSAFCGWQAWGKTARECPKLKCPLPSYWPQLQQ